MVFLLVLLFCRFDLKKESSVIQTYIIVWIVYVMSASFFLVLALLQVGISYNDSGPDGHGPTHHL